MNYWEKIFGSYLNSGIYTSGPVRKNSLIKKAAAGNNLNYTIIDTKKVIDKNSFLYTMEHSLDFPAYFGMNWDALSENLTDMSWKPASGYVLVLTNFRAVRGNIGSDLEIINRIFDSTVQYWKERGSGFYIILSE